MRWLGFTVAMLTFATCGGESTPRGEATGPLLLFDEEAARELRLTDEEWLAVERPRGAAAGPRVVVYQPDLGETEDGGAATTESPLDIVLEFQENLAPVDMTSLDVHAKRRWIPVRRSLTEKLAEYVQGNRLVAEEVSVPSGRYLLTVTIADVEGRLTELAFRLRVL